MIFNYSHSTQESEANEIIFSTEAGQLMTSFRENGDYNWNYLKVSPSLRPFIRWDQQGSDIYELVILNGWPSKVAITAPMVHTQPKIYSRNTTSKKIPLSSSTKKR